MLGQQTVKQRFSLEAQVKAITAVYDNLLGMTKKTKFYAPGSVVSARMRNL
jgi:hypothetical protein